LQVHAIGGEEVDIGRHYLLAIGIDQYVNPTLNLRTCVNGATALRDLLVGSFTFEAEDCQLLLDGAATREGIIGALHALTGKVTARDSVILYYAGHGHLDDVSRTGSWIPADGTFETPAKWVKNSEVKDYIRAMKARHVLLIADSCFAGDFFRGPAEPQMRGEDSALRRAFLRSSRCAMTAGGKEPVSDEGFPGHSIYTGWLLKALAEAALTSPCIVPEELHDRLKGAVAANARQRPMFGRLYDAGGEPDASYLFFRRGTASLEQALAEKLNRIKQLAELDRDAATRLAQQQEEIAAKQLQMAALNRRIAVLQQKLGVPSTGGSDLDEIYQMVQERERRDRELQELRRQAEEELLRKELELATARQRQEAARRQAFTDDLEKYHKVAAAPFLDAEAKQRAWLSFCEKHGIPTTTQPHQELEWTPGGVRVGPLGAARLGGAFVVVPEATLAPLDHLAEGSAEAQARQQALVQAGWPLEVQLGRSGIRFRLVPGGTFTMGSPATEPDRDRDETPREITLSGPLYVSATEITQYEWSRVMGGNPAHFLGAGPAGPVEQVSWEDVQAFTTRLAQLERLAPGKLRLPTEAEWEYLARAGTRTAVCTGQLTRRGANHAPELGLTAWYGGNSVALYPGGVDCTGWPERQYRHRTAGTSEVARKLPNAFGLYDCIGNVAEWCQDWYAPYAPGPHADPSGPATGENRVARGGSYLDGVTASRNAYRTRYPPATRANYLGFRLVFLPPR
jgi:formylglycine-generating enzyme required for sulfatase activity